MEKYVIYIIGVGYYKGKTFKNTNAKGLESMYPYTTNDAINAKQYSSYGMALRGMKALTGKCDNIPSCTTKRLSECEVLAHDD